ncbi:MULTISPECIES: hypothetical protein [unclassified Variovorax]|uniref:hypothetical protein n=1 Tax=unclassified Variovorax TaxID=663243 RepID=UPI0025753282|nr:MULTISPECIES: hypothetical protein [unclassified Variovorax]MDM0086771.1 hypothetical protein [Variovorax sp. J22G40]MDM0144973.1 hypothetical protein [Variovorax sp. J2P1-31]
MINALIARWLIGAIAALVIAALAAATDPEAPTVAEARAQALARDEALAFKAEDRLEQALWDERMEARRARR